MNAGDSFHGATNTADANQPPPYQEQDPYAVSHCVSAPADLGFQMAGYLYGSHESLTPPSDETDAPPSYQDATSMPVWPSFQVKQQ